MGIVRIGARGSKLSLTQAEWVVGQLRAARPGLTVELVIIQTTGDQLRDVSLSVLGGQGVFTKEIERALMAHEIDVAVHSLKDLPTTVAEGLRLAAITRRESPQDCLVAARQIDLARLDASSPIGTSSLRRQAQLKRINPRLRAVELRGNVPTRIEKMLRGEVAAVVLAHAGLRRLGLHPPWMRTLSVDEMLPAPGQGALGLEIRAEDAFAAQCIAPLNDPDTFAACTAERAFLRAFGGGCRAPIAALGEVVEGRLRLDGLIASPDAELYYRGRSEEAIADAVLLGELLAERLKSRGAQAVMDAAQSQPAAAIPNPEVLHAGRPLSGRRIVVTRDEDADGPLSCALRDEGAEPLILPLIAEAPPEDPAPLRHAVEHIDEFDWIVFSSMRAVHVLARLLNEQGKSLADAAPSIACVGPRTDEALAESTSQRRAADLVAAEPGAEGLLRLFKEKSLLAGKAVLYPRSQQALPLLRDGLHGLGARVEDPIAYRQARGQGFAEVAALVRGAGCDAITFASPSAVEAFVEAVGEEDARRLSDQVLFASIGPTTSQTMARHNLPAGVEAAERSFAGLVAALVRVLGR